MVIFAKPSIDKILFLTYGDESPNYFMVNILINSNRKYSIIAFTLVVVTILTLPLFSRSKKMRFAGGSQGLTYHAMGESLGRVGGFKWLTLTTRGTVQNIKLIASGKADLGFAQTDILIKKALVKSRIKNSVKILLPVYDEELHLLTTTDIESIADLKGKRVSIGPSGSGVRGTTKILLRAAGLALKDMTINKSKTQVALQKILIKKEIDALFIVAGSPADMLAKLPAAANRRIHMIPIEDSLFTSVSAQYPYKRKTISASTYPWLQSDINTLAVSSAIVGKSSLKSAFVTKLLRKIFSSKSQLARSHRKWNDLNKAAVKQYVNRYSRYFHPAAVKYLKKL